MLISLSYTLSLAALKAYSPFAPFHTYTAATAATTAAITPEKTMPKTETLRHSCLLILLLSAAANAAAAATAVEPKHDLVRRSCVHASYPDVCLRTLASYGGASSTPRDLAQAAVRVSLSHARRASDFLSSLRPSGRRDQGALADCVDQMGDSVDELGRTLAALKHLNRGADFRWQMSNAETWVSAALTNEDTCLDGFKEFGGGPRRDVRRRITNVARVTSNALYLINLLEDTTSG